MQMLIHGNPGRAVILLKQLKQLKLSGTLRNPDVECFARFYGSPAVCQALTTSKAYKRLSRGDRRAVVESYVNEYRAANGGKFPTLRGTIKEVGGGFYVVRDIFQELKLKQNAPMPIVAKALSEVPASVPNDASSQSLNDPQSHSAASFSTGVVDSVFQADTIETGSDERWATIVFSHPDSDEITLEGSNLVVSAAKYVKRETETTPNNDVDSKWVSNAHLSESQKEAALEACFKNSETEEEEILTHLGSQESKVDHLEGAAVSEIVVPTEEAKITKYSDEINLQGDNLVITATQEKMETETAPNNDVDSKWDSTTQMETETTPNNDVDSKWDNTTHLPESQKSILLEESSKNSETKEEENLTHLGSRESKADHLEGAVVSANGVPTEEAKITKYSDEINLQGTETAPYNDVDSKCDSTTHLPGSEKRTVLEDCKNSEAEEKEILTHLGSQESKVDDLEGAANSANVVPTEETKITRQVSERGAVEVETREGSSAWSNIMSFAKEFANFWRKR